MEAAPAPESRHVPQYFEDPRTGTRWELRPDGTRVPFEADTDLEFERQQIVYANGETPTPTDGFPLFPRTISFKNIDDPTLSGGTAPIGAPSAAMGPSAPDAASSPFLDATRTTANPKLDLNTIPLKNRISPERHKLDVDRGVIGTLHAENANRKEVPSIQQILNDPQMSELFGELLRTHGDEDLILVFRKDGLEKMIQADVDTLRYRQHEFFNRLTIAEELRESTTPEDVSLMFAKSPALGLFRNMFPSEKSVELIKNQIYLLAMREDESHVEAMRDMQRENKRVRELPEFQRLKAQVLSVCEKHNIPIETLDRIDDSVIRAFQHGDSHTLKKLDKHQRKLVQQLMYPGFWKSVTGKDTMGNRAAMLMTIRENLSHGETAEGQGLAELLGKSISGDPRIIRELVDEARTGKKAVRVGEDDVKNDAGTKREYSSHEAGVKEAIKKIDEVALEKATSEAQWEYARATGKYDISAWDDGDREECTKIAMNSLYDSNGLREVRARRGWFSRMLTFMFESLFSDIKSQVQEKMHTSFI